MTLAVVPGSAAQPPAAGSAPAARSSAPVVAGSLPALPRSRPALPGWNATLVERDDLTHTLARFIVRPEADAPVLRAGQYVSLGLLRDGRLVQRPYSPASPAGAETLELYVRLVPRPCFTELLWGAAPGQPIHVGRPKGLFVLDPDPAPTSLFVATGTGIAPFVSMLRSMRAAGEMRSVVLIHGVSHVEELGYRDLLEAWAREPDLVYVPTISRPDDARNAGWDGRTGRAETVLAEVVAEHAVDRATSIAYLCGNPSMIAAGEATLSDLGFPADRIRSEHYWPADRPELG